MLMPSDAWYASRRRTGPHVMIVFLFAVGLFGLHHWIALCYTQGAYTPFSVEPGTSALVSDETHYYAPGPKYFASTGRVFTELNLYEYRDRPTSNPTLPTILIGS